MWAFLPSLECPLRNNAGVDQVANFGQATYGSNDVLIWLEYSNQLEPSTTSSPRCMGFDVLRWTLALPIVELRNNQGHVTTTVSQLQQSSMILCLCGCHGPNKPSISSDRSEQSLSCVGFHVLITSVAFAYWVQSHLASPRYSCPVLYVTSMYKVNPSTISVMDGACGHSLHCCMGGLQVFSLFDV